MSVTGANVGLKRSWGRGYNGWDVDMDRNLLLLDVLVQGVVASLGDTSPPGSPSTGDAYVLGASPSGAWSGHAKDLAIYTG